MRKNSKLIVLLLIVFLLTGCGGPSTERKVKKVLKERYPDDTFVITRGKDILISSATGCKEVVEGHTWKVTSNTTGLTFNLIDKYYFNSFVCVYTFDNDYFYVYLNDYFTKHPDSRVTIPDEGFKIDPDSGEGYIGYFSEIKIDYYKFSSNEELADYIVKLQKQLFDDPMILKLKPTYFWLTVTKSGEYYASVEISAADDYDYVLEKLNSNNNA